MKKQIDICDCPGAWYGTTPKPEYAGQGHIVIDPQKTEEALKWLKRRFFVNIRCATTDKGLMIDVHSKQNAGCDRCGTFDRMPGSRLCAECAKDE